MYHSVRSSPKLRTDLKIAGHNRSIRRIPRCLAIQTTTTHIEERHTLPDKMQLEVLAQIPNEQSEKPPMLFLHGSAHGAWCWKENFLPYFSERGYPSYAISLRGQGKSDRGNLKTSGTLESHADDINHFAQTLPKRPILIGHSFTGLFVQYICLKSVVGDYCGAVTLCSTPPSGNQKMIQRFLRRDFVKSIKITWGLSRRTFINDTEMCKFLFFSDDIPQEDFQRYHNQIGDCSPIIIVDVSRINKFLPLDPLETRIPALVVGAENDNIVDMEAVEETAKWFGEEGIILPNMAHDVMLDTRWEQAASLVFAWAETLTENQQTIS